jgi:hypothetical protein
MDAFVFLLSWCNQKQTQIMKHLLKYSVIIAFIGISIGSFGQSKADKALQKKIIGDWKYKEMKFELNDNATPEEKETVGLAEVFVQQFTQLAYSFEKNGKFKRSFQDMVYPGTWAINKGVLVMSSEDGKREGDTDMAISINKDILTILSKVSEGLSTRLILKKQ